MHRAADELVDDRDRAAVAARPGSGSAGTAAKSSATSPMSTSTRSAPRTTASRSAAEACRTATVRGRQRRAHSRAHDRGTDRDRCNDSSRSRRRAASPTPGRVFWACRVTGPRQPEWMLRPGSGWPGGYVGTGVTATNLAGRTLAIWSWPRTDAHLPGSDTGRRWEPEPLRWLAVNAIYAPTARPTAPRPPARPARPHSRTSPT